MIMVVQGLGFGLLVGALMRAPAITTFLPAYAITISVMAALWLGPLLVPSNGRGFWGEVAVAGVTFTLIAMTMQIIPEFILVAMGLQIAWSVAHWFYGSGAVVQRWYPPFATGANVGLLIAFVIFWWVL
ncbi:MAG: hypothetical protein AAF903_00735 [Pseudomonadota bacterium]